MEFHTFSSPHLPVAPSVALLMRRVLYALVPGAIALWWFFGWGVILNVVLAMVTGVAAEAVMLRLRGRPLAPFLGDGSALVTGALLGLALPPLAPWWIPVIGSLFAIVVAKQLYGGLGYNPFNPAMVGYVVLLISFPREMTLWPTPTVLTGAAPDLLESLRIVFLDVLPEGRTLDGLTSATPLDAVKTRLGLSQTLTEIRVDPLFGAWGGTGWEWINLGFLAGGLYMLLRGVIAWQIPAAVLLGLALMALLAYGVDADTYPSPMFHLLSGGTMLGAFFIATDPISAATTPRGRLIYGLGIGVLIYVIRTWGGYPDGVAFAVLLMNMATPTIDHYTRPRVFGERHGE